MRHKATALILAVTALVAACVDPVEPRAHDVPATASLASQLALELAHFTCGEGPNGEWNCGITITYADGSTRQLA